MNLNDILAGGFVLFMIFYFCTLYRIIVNTKIGEIDDRTNL